MFKRSVVCLALLASMSVFAADKPAEKTPLLEMGGFKVGIAPDYSERQYDWNEWLQEKFLEPLIARQAGIMSGNGLYIGGLFRASFIAEKSNTANKFPLLSRFPAQHSGTTGSRFTINNATLGFTANMGDWVSFVGELMATETEYPGQTSLQMRRAFVTIGNLNKSPFYLGFGKNFVDFGDMGAYNPFTHTMNAHYFHVQTDTPAAAFGYFKDDLHIVATAMQGGRQLRVADSPTASHVNNFAINATKTFKISQDMKLKLGAGYLHNTIYNTLIPHHTVAQAAGQVKVDNPAFDLNATLSYKNFDLQAEYTSTTKKWLASSHIVQAMSVQGRYKTQTFGYNSSFSLGWGKGIQGAPGTNFEQMTQIIAGYQVQLHKQISFGVEYGFAKGFVPLIALQQTGDQNVKAHTLITGIKAHF